MARKRRPKDDSARLATDRCRNRNDSESPGGYSTQSNAGFKPLEDAGKVERHPLAEMKKSP
jgi:hypothetical protein